MANPPQVESEGNRILIYMIPIEDEQRALDAISHFRTMLTASGLEEQGGTVEHVSGADGQQGASYSMSMQKMVGTSSNRRLKTFVYKFDITERSHDRVVWTTNCNGSYQKTTTVTVGRNRDENGKLLLEARLEYRPATSAEKCCGWCVTIVFLPLALPFLLCYPCIKQCMEAQKKATAVAVQQYFVNFTPPQSVAQNELQTNVAQPAQQVNIPAAQTVNVMSAESIPSSAPAGYGGNSGIDTGLPPAITNTDMVKRF